MKRTYTGRARNLLTVARLADFRDWLMHRGWRAEAIIGRDEHLRMRNSEDDSLLLVTGREKASTHVTVSGVALELAQEFLAERKKGVPR